MSDPTVEEAPKGIVLSQRAYDLLKDAQMMLLPAIGAFYATMASIWHWAYSIEIIGTLAAFAVLLGVLLKISSVTFKAKVQVAVVNAKMEELSGGAMTPGTYSR